MLKFKPLLTLAAILVTVILLVPTLMVLPFVEGKVSGQLAEELETETEPAPAPGEAKDAAVEVAVFRSAQSRVDRLPLDQYLVGVVASEMPAEFELEALKAQAVTARTYYVKQLAEGGTANLPEGAQMTDTEAHQVFKNTEELKQIWGKDYSWKMDKIAEAVRATDGQILTYKGEPITATFFSTSNGYTENSEDYWKNEFPYLRSVESPWDVGTPKYTSKTKMAVSVFERKLGIKLGGAGEIGKITERTAGQRVSKVEIGGKTLTGKQVREKLGLRSSDFTWSISGNEVVIETKGYGHGVGMSQYGANGMAAKGKNYQDIVKHYYQGIEIAPADSQFAKATAKK